MTAALSIPPTITFTPAERHVFAKHEDISVSAWAARDYIVQDGKYAGGPVRLDAAPPLAGIMDAFGSPFVEEVIVCGSPQSGKTLALYACLGYCVARRPGTKMLVMPTKEARDRVAQEKLKPALKGSPALRRLVGKMTQSAVALRDGSSLFLAHAESQSQRASISVQDLFIDEEDLSRAESGGSLPVEDFKGRTRSYGNRRKVMRVSQPKGEQSSIFTAVTVEADLLLCREVRCPACNHGHLPSVDNLFAAEGEKDPRLIRQKRLGRYRCPACKWLWSDHMRDLAVKRGSWKPYAYTQEHGFTPAPAPPARPVSIGFHLPAILSRETSLSVLLARKMTAEASDDPAVMRQFCNDELALPFSPVEEQSDVELVLARRDTELPPKTVPHGAVALTCGIDAQKLGFYYAVTAWMPTLASYVIDYGYLQTWDQVTSLVFDTAYPVRASGEAGNESTGEVMMIWRAGIDTGGTRTEGVYSRTEEVYEWVRTHGAGVAHACKGASHEQLTPVRWRKIDKMPSGKAIPGGLILYFTDTHMFKTLVFKRLREDAHQPLRLHAGADADFAAQICGERLVRKNGRLVWEKVGENHYLDCMVLNLACADASWTPSLHLYLLQMRAALEAESAPRPERKARPRREKRSRW